MRRLVCSVAVALTVVACQEAPPVAPARDVTLNADGTSSTSDVIPGQYIVLLKPTAQDVRGIARALVATHGGTLGFVYQHALQGFSVRLPDTMVSLLARNPLVEYIEPDKIVHIVDTENNATWGIDRIDQRDTVDGYYNYFATGEGVDAYIIDTGIRFSHREFEGRATSGIDEVDKDNDASDCHGHGTHVSGTVGGKTYGVAKKVHLVGVRVLDCTGSGSTSGVIAGINWVDSMRIQGRPGIPAVANMSLGGGYDSLLNKAVRNAVNDSVIFVVAAGNEYGNPCLGSTTYPGPESPSSEPSAITVGATAINDFEADFSNRGPCLDIFEPVVNSTSR